ncbi:MAG: hypothetical protein KatS3mg052_1916 [Candidatus Roseilinea sp.]|nr:MAG: hypothetical protein KatS3mg052_1916 [Candidatus Roseilinea sp.]
MPRRPAILRRTYTAIQATVGSSTAKPRNGPVSRFSNSNVSASQTVTTLGMASPACNSRVPIEAPTPRGRSPLFVAHRHHDVAGGDVETQGIRHPIHHTPAERVKLHGARAVEGHARKRERLGQRLRVGTSAIRDAVGIPPFDGLSEAEGEHACGGAALPTYNLASALTHVKVSAISLIALLSREVEGPAQ